MLFRLPFSYALVSFISYASQYAFQYIEPGPLTRGQSVLLNLGTFAVFISYARCVITDAGKVTTHAHGANGVAKTSAGSGTQHTGKQRWCRKCDAYKPPRAHHCKVCKRCVLKMDHHCPWTINCVGYRTIPHFVRFINWGFITMLYLQKQFLQRGYLLWENRNQAYYLGPSQGVLILLLLAFVFTCITLFFIGVLWVKTIYCLGCNMTSVESWETDRHAVLLKRARKRGGYLNGPGGTQIQIKHHEFPYDVGIYRNIAQSMGSSSPLMWLWPLAPSPTHESGMQFEENGFLDAGLSWPPPDPDKMPAQRKLDRKADTSFAGDTLNDDQYVVAFRQRQQKDMRRRRGVGTALQGPGTSCGGLPGAEDEDEETRDVVTGSKWENEAGESLDFYGVDDDDDGEDAGEEEEEDDDDVPLAELIARRKAR